MIIEEQEEPKKPFKVEEKPEKVKENKKVIH